MGLKDLKRQGGQPDPRQVAQQIQGNTAAMLQQAGVNVPASAQGSAGSIINYLLKTGQIDQKRLQQAQAMAARFRGGR